MANTLFIQYTERVLDEVLSWDPAHASQLGWESYDRSMRDMSAAAYAHQATRLRAILDDLRGFRDCDLSEEERIDRDLATHIFQITLFEIEELRMHERMALATEDLGSALFFLFAREDGPLDRRIDSITARLEKVPELETGRELLPFMDTIETHALAMFGRTDRTARLSSAVRQAKDALHHYNQWLEKEVLPAARSASHVSADVFERYMKLKGFDITPEEALEVGRAHLLKTRDQMTRTAGRIVRSGSVAYRRDIQRAREFLIRRDLVTVPDDEDLRVIETPTFMRHLAPFAAQYEPGKFTGSRTGMFLVTPNDNPDLLREHCYPMISNTAVHEAYPGHHLQGICGNTHPSHVRVLSNSMDFAEGWALYCEELMLEQGFNDTPEGRLAQLSDLMFRVVRVLADVRLARGETTPEEVAEMLVLETGMQRNAAMSEARSYTVCPTYYLSYFIGKMALLQLLEDVKLAMGDRFSMKLFHDTMLYAGCLPMPFMRREMAMRLRQEYGVELGEPRERLVEFALREAAK